LAVRELLGHDIALPETPPCPDLVGLGLSDADLYAAPLARKFRYENTWYHMTPRVDITSIPNDRVGRYDFVIASDVFEHVAPPVERAFVNARRLLRRGGRLIFSVPFTLADETLEHFPELHDWKLSLQDGKWVLDNITTSGKRETFADLVFHGGPGSTLEMRIFSRSALERAFLEAGFARVRVAAEPYLPFGIHWHESWSPPLVAYAD
jgi:SAM-dependent methyltransferase